MKKVGKELLILTIATLITSLMVLDKYGVSNNMLEEEGNLLAS